MTCQLDWTCQAKTKEENVILFTKNKFFRLMAILSLSGSILYACNSPAQSTTQSSDGANGVVEVVYFHRSQRCSSCLRAEDSIRRTIETYFRDELASGKLVFKVLNVQDEVNAATVEKYGAAGSSLYINEIKDGSDNIEEVTDIWFLLNNDKAFIKAVKSEIEKHLGR